MKNLLRRTLSDCGAKPKDLSEKSGISLSVISRYMNGSRTPDLNGEKIDQLAEALCALVQEHDPSSDLTKEEMLSRLKAAILAEHPQYTSKLNADNLKKLIIAMEMSATALAEGLYYSPSGLSRILSKQNTPRNVHGFVEMLTDFVVKRCGAEREPAKLLDLVETCTGSRPIDKENAVALLGDWLLDTKREEEEKGTKSLLTSLDEFNIAEYMAGIDTEAIKAIPMTKLKIPVTKKYTGQSGLETGITDFFKATVTSSSNQPIFVYSDHPIEYLSDKPEVLENWTKGIGACILQGKKVEVIHNMNRPLRELIMGMEKWIPIYMTGNVRSYYSEKTGGNFFNHILFVSGAAVFQGHAAGNLSEGSYLFSKNTSRIAEGRKNANSLMEGCEVLVEVFTKETIAEYQKYIREDAKMPGERIVYNDSLPSYTLSDELLESILKKNEVSTAAAKEMKDFIRREKKRIAEISKHSRIREIVYLPKEIDGEGSPSAEYELPIRELNTGTVLHYSFDEYLEHYRLTCALEAENENYQLTRAKEKNFKRMRIAVHSNTHAVISRNMGEPLHFLLHYPALVDSVETALHQMMDGEER